MISIRKARWASTAGFFALLVPVGVVIASNGSLALAVDDSSEARSAAIHDVKACLDASKEKTLDVMYLMDGSGSLIPQGSKSGTDPDGLRFDAVENSIDPLARLARDGVKVNIAAASFGDSARSVVDWTPVTDDNAAALGETLGQSLRDDYAQDTNARTNWTAGIDLASRELAKQKESSDGCQVLIWITDGGINVGDAAQDAGGIADLCGVLPTEVGTGRATGSMFGLRNQRVVVLGLLLSDPNDTSPDKQTFFKPVVEGSGEVSSPFFGVEQGSFKCGRTVDEAQGAQIPATSAGDLANILWALSVCISESCFDSLTGDLQSDPTSPGSWLLPVQLGVSAVLVQSGSPITSITSPDGEEVCSQIDGCDRGGVRIPVLGKPGFWTISSSGADLHEPFAVYLTGIKLAAMDPPKLAAGDEAAIEINVSQEDQPLTEKSFGEPASMSAEYRRTGQEPVTVKLERKSASQWVTTQFSPQGSGKLWMTFKASTKATTLPQGVIPDLQLTHESIDLVKVIPAAIYPSIVDPEDGEDLGFPAIEGTTSSTATILVRGPEEGDGQVCVRGAVVDDDPAGTEAGGRSFAAMAGEAECSPGLIGEGQEVKVEIALTPDGQATGVARGYLSVDLVASEADKEVLSQSIPITVETTVAKNQGARIGVILVLVLFGILAPYVILLVSVRRMATFPKSLDTRFAMLPITVGPSGLISVGEIEPAEYAFIYMGDSAVQRRVATGPLIHEVRPPRFWPFGKAVCVVVGSPDSCLLSNYSSKVADRRNEAPSKVALGEVFVAIVPASVRPEADVETQSATPSQWDSWDVVSSTAPSAGAPLAGSPDGQVNGHVLVMVPNGPGMSSRIAETLATVRMWPMWGDVYMMATQPIPTSQNNAVNETKKSTSNKNKTKNKKSESGHLQTPAPTDDW